MAKEVFEKFLNEHNLKIQIINSKEKTHTAQQAAETHNIPVRNIIKSILVKIDDEPILFLAPGDKRIDLEEKKKEFNARDIKVANAEEVKDITGHSIGGVPPFGHKKKIKTFIEKGFNGNEKLLAAAGSPNSVFKISLVDLKKIISTS